MRKFSVCCAHWNRKDLLLKNFTRIRDLYPNLDFEFSVCDDGSDGSETPLPADFPFQVLLHYLENHKIPRSETDAINKAVRLSNSEWIVLTNPEVYHLFPCLNVLPKKLDPGSYYVFPMLHADREMSKKIVAGEKLPLTKGFELIGGEILPSRNYMGYPALRWSAHPKYHPEPFHNLVVFHRSFWEKIGGFPRDFMRGIAWGDQWLIYMAKKNLKLEWQKSPAVHLWHPELFTGEREKKLMLENMKIYESLIVDSLDMAL